MFYHIISEPNLLWVRLSCNLRGITMFAKCRIAVRFFTSKLKTKPKQKTQTRIVNKITLKNPWCKRCHSERWKGKLQGRKWKHWTFKALQNKSICLASTRRNEAQGPVTVSIFLVILRLYRYICRSRLCELLKNRDKSNSY